MNAEKGIEQILKGFTEYDEGKITTAAVSVIVRATVEAVAATEWEAGYKEGLVSDEDEMELDMDLDEMDEEDEQ